MNVLGYYKERGLYVQYKDQLEYMFLRELWGAFFRIGKMPDKCLRRSILKENWQILNKTFPCWRKNKILKKENSLRDIYFKSVNKYTYKIYSKIFCIGKK
jgi:hypothetical protein